MGDAAAETRAVTAAIDAALQPHGYKRTRGVRHRAGESIVVLTSLQRSQYGARYYLNLGIHFDEASVPTLGDWHMRGRLENLLPDNDRRSLLPFDMERSEAIANRAGNLIDLLTRVLVPFFDQCTSIAAISKMQSEGCFIGWGLRQPALDALALSTPM